MFYFTIERSKDGQFWERIVAIDGQGTTTNLISYKYLDESPLVDVSYYRLKQTDLNGEFSYSTIKTVVIERNKDLQAYPNPTIDFVTISNANGERGDLVVMDIEGKTFNDLVRIDRLDEEIWQIDLSPLPVGIYFIGTSDLLRRVVKK